MANLELSLSAKAREDGKHQVLVRVSSSRSVRFRIKSGVFVSLQFWSDSLHTVKVPVFRKTNKAVVDAARAEEAALDNYVSELKAIICAGEDMPGVTLSPEWIDHCYELRPILQDERNHFLPSITNGLFSPPNIQRAERMVEERQAAEKSDVEQKERNRLLYDLIQDYCRARNLAESRIKVYRVLGRMLGRFESFVQLTDKKRKGYSLVVVATGGSHANLTDHYAAIPAEMKSVAQCFGQPVLRGLTVEQMTEKIGELRSKVSDRALLRAFHFIQEDERVPEQVAALKEDRIRDFLKLIIDSGRSSYMYLQNIYADPADQSLSLALCLAENMLQGRGAWRIHGGGFAGTTLNFVPQDLTETFVNVMEQAFGEGACSVLNIRPVGAARVVV